MKTSIMKAWIQPCLKTTLPGLHFYFLTFTLQSMYSLSLLRPHRVEFSSLTTKRSLSSQRAPGTCPESPSRLVQSHGLFWMCPFFCSAWPVQGLEGLGAEAGKRQQHSLLRKIPEAWSTGAANVGWTRCRTGWKGPSHQSWTSWKWWPRSSISLMSSSLPCIWG